MTVDLITCAVCQDQHPRSSCRREPIGINDRLVWVCKGCREDPPVARKVERPAYDMPEDVRGLKEALVAFEKRNPQPKKRGRPKKSVIGAMSIVPIVPRDPRCKLHRINRHVGGRLLTFEEALDIAESKDWYTSSVFIGGDVRAWCWQEIEPAKVAIG